MPVITPVTVSVTLALAVALARIEPQIWKSSCPWFRQGRRGRGRSCLLRRLSALQHQPDMEASRPLPMVFVPAGRAALTCTPFVVPGVVWSMPTLPIMADPAGIAAVTAASTELSSTFHLAIGS